MPKPYPAEFRQRAVALVRAGKPVTVVAPSLGISDGVCAPGSGRTGSITARSPARLPSRTLSSRLPANASENSSEKSRSSASPANCLGGQASPKRIHPVIDVLVAAGHPVLTCCRILGVSKPGYYRYRIAPPRPRQCVENGSRDSSARSTPPPEERTGIDGCMPN